VGDVTDKTSLTAIADRVRKEHGYVNFLFANSGVAGPKVREFFPQKEPDEKPTVHELQEALWKPEMLDFSNTLHVNCTGVFYTIVAFLDLLDAGTKKHNLPSDAQILVTSSVASFSRHLASSFAYSASKAAVNHLVKMISTLCAQNRYRIRCSMYFWFAAERPSRSVKREFTNHVRVKT
jgi:NAD(P)-dependent dehydrogenase (short-subunit alcohol dehydrogenase family)